jgi:SAM-dependent methyltransferase
LGSGEALPLFTPLASLIKEYKEELLFMGEYAGYSVVYTLQYLIEVCKMDKSLIEGEEVAFKFYLDMFNDLPIKIDSSSTILDFGCGLGGIVYFFRKKGFRAFGVDLQKHYELAEQLCHQENLDDSEKIFHPIDMNNYKLPFADNTFDVVFSNHVFEHVHNFSESIEEIKRVLKPGGYSLHLFPSRYRPIESHVYIPLASVFQGYKYLRFWTSLGIGNKFGQELSPQEFAKFYANYLKRDTNYPPPAKVKKYFADSFGHVDYVENLLIKNSPGGLRHIKPLAKIFPLTRLIVRYFHEQVIFVQKTV